MKKLLYRTVLEHDALIPVYNGFSRLPDDRTFAGHGLNTLLPMIECARPLILSTEWLNAKITTDVQPGVHAPAFDLALPFDAVFFEGQDECIADFIGEKTGSTVKLAGVCVQRGVPEDRDADYYPYFCWFWDNAGQLRCVFDSWTRDAFHSEDAKERLWEVHNYISLICNSLRAEGTSAGELRVNEKFRVGQGGGRKPVRVRKVIVIDLQRNQRTYAARGLHVDWTHRWEVRGHWRKVDGIGKDGADNYIVKGMTWVTPYIKGPEGKQLVKKLRLVRGSLDDAATRAG